MLWVKEEPEEQPALRPTFNVLSTSITSGQELLSAGNDLRKGSELTEVPEVGFPLPSGLACVCAWPAAAPCETGKWKFPSYPQRLGKTS